MDSGVETEQQKFVRLYVGSLIPLRVVLAALAWVVYDYFLTITDEICYIWRQKRGLGKYLYFWIRYYTLFLLGFDTFQIHGYALPGVATKDMCVAVDPVVRMVGVVSLWSVEIIMMLRIHALYNRSRKIAIFNITLFLISIGLFLWIMVINAINRKHLIAEFIHLPLPGCPAINGGTQWAQWIPATVFEITLFVEVVYKGWITAPSETKVNGRSSLVHVLIHENTIYFFVVAVLLIFNNLMVINSTKIPWFSLAPFHAALGITTTRMLIHLRKFAYIELERKTFKTNLVDISGTRGLEVPVFFTPDDLMRSQQSKTHPKTSTVSSESSGSDSSFGSQSVTFDFETHVEGTGTSVDAGGVSLDESMAAWHSISSRRLHDSSVPQDIEAGTPMSEVSRYSFISRVSYPKGANDAGPSRLI